MRTLCVLIFLAALFALCSAQQTSKGKSVKENAFSKIVPRLLWKRGESQESHKSPVIYVQRPYYEDDYDRHDYRHHRNPYYSYYGPPPPPPPPPPPSRPFNPFNGMEYANTAGSGPTFLVINPSNMQGIYLPASTTAGSSNSTNSTSSRRSAFVPSIADLLQGLNLDDLADGSLFEDDSEVVNAAENGTAEEAPISEGTTTQADDDGDAEDVISEDAVEALERQTNRGLSPKHLVSIIMQDKRRRRIQEVLAGIYLRNYNLNRK
ncbi:uncharacterized protein LOC108044577 [Drosophila rhopaloa]|uniref:Uncharacterized protein LOC108044577 n=1 Tax=Drosophila rhopaloa TaxID=1041015 RepID=A0A6P4ER35_DRORH|nr:uncharacterized protein LOC108044577 [Drosophila rhopaloa]